VPDTSSQPAFQPYVPDGDKRFELTIRAILFGAIFGIIFGAVTVYVGLRAGLTVSASIPISVLSISILRALGRYLPPFGAPTILENNIVQTTGSAGESVAAGVIFTLPALIFLGFPLPSYFRIFVLALIGGWLGVMFMIPLRRQLIVKEHGNLLYPEGTACADVLVAGDKGGSFAGRVFAGLGLGSLYTLFQSPNICAAFPDTPNYSPAQMPGASIRANITSEYLGVGYIIGPKIAGVILAGGVFSWLVMMPAIKFFGSHLPTAIYPGTIPIGDMTSDDLYRSYVRYIGAGAVAAAGLITLLKTLPTILAALKAGAKDLGSSVSADSQLRTQRDLPIGFALSGAGLLIVMLWCFLTFQPIPGAETSMFANLMASLFVGAFGFLFVTVSSRIVGIIGQSASPISGMTIATLMATSAIFLVLGWTSSAFAALALTVGGVVCIAAANAGNTSQDLKTGFLVGATPWRQQLSLVVGVFAAVFVVGLTLTLMNKAGERFTSSNVVIDANHLPDGASIQSRAFDHDGKNYWLINVLGSPSIPEGKYLYNPTSQKVETQWEQGIGGPDAAAPQARLMSVVINGILTRKLPWGLVLMGVFLVVVVELLGIRSLAFAVGSYLSIATTLAIFCGGMVRWMVDASMGQKGGEHSESEVSPGSLYASGLIAAGGIIGLSGMGLKIMEIQHWVRKDLLKFGDSLSFLNHAWVSVVAFALLAASLFYFARKPLEGGKS
jgi:putative OPT family oligopeptide transporter